ncbi:MAG: hypothetical protein OXI87_12795 [Albidovulum sp.]|nr:hypothetical protein [Albidovulum sp.]MDE0305736.1 hypothetical protein [Albidovulum sp.]MDE0533804.1 hypothetical protein [Albidovulum sp.]
MLKRGYKGIYHHIGEMRLKRYVAGIAGCHNVREGVTMQRMEAIVVGKIGKCLNYRDLVS